VGIGNAALMTSRKPLPADLGAGPFTVADALSLGVTRDRLSAADLMKPFAGIRMPARSTTPPPQSDEDWLQVFSAHQRENRDLCAAYQLRMPAAAFYCGPTAALLHGAPLPYRLSADRRLHVGSPDDCRAVQVVGAIGHSYSVDPAQVTTGLVGRLTTPERTWCDLARTLRLADLVAVGDYLIRWSNPLTSRDRLAKAVDTQKGQRGVKNLRTALTLLNERAESPKESILRVQLILGGLPEPEVNVDVFDSFGQFVARADLLFRAHHLILEYEGLQHLFDPAQWQRDIERTRKLEDEGWRVIRVTKADLANPRDLIVRINTHIRTRAGRLV
jgi:very-short-patch-repair endonuclease